MSLTPCVGRCITCSSLRVCPAAATVCWENPSVMPAALNSPADWRLCRPTNPWRSWFPVGVADMGRWLLCHQQQCAPTLPTEEGFGVKLLGVTGPRPCQVQKICSNGLAHMQHRCTAQGAACTALLHPAVNLLDHICLCGLRPYLCPAWGPMGWSWGRPWRCCCEDLSQHSGWTPARGSWWPAESTAVRVSYTVCCAPCQACSGATWSRLVKKVTRFVTSQRLSCGPRSRILSKPCIQCSAVHQVASVSPVSCV